MINNVVLVGRLTKDVEVRKTQSGLSVAMFTVACDKPFTSKQDAGNGNQSTCDFISCVAWRQSADFLGSYGRKGSLVGVEGRISTRNYDKDGQRVYVTEVTCNRVQLLGSKRDNDNANTSNYGNSTNSYGNRGNGYQQNSGYSQNTNASFNNSSSDDMNSGDPLNISSDDLPF